MVISAVLDVKLPLNVMACKKTCSSKDSEMFSLKPLANGILKVTL